MAKPFRYRGGWRAQVTLTNGARRTADFKDGEYRDAVQWIADQLANANSLHEPKLGGPTAATLAQALAYYARFYTLNKNGRVGELNRINHYLEGAGMPPLKAVKNDTGGLVLVEHTQRQLPEAWQKHNSERRGARSQTYAQIATLACKRCNSISTADVRELTATMATEGLSPSTIQKEIALLKHTFNMAAAEWNWDGFKNPCKGIKLGKSAIRFVVVTTEQKQALYHALAQCDNPYFWPLVEVAIQTTLRQSSLLKMRWDNTDLEGRIAMLPSKTGQVSVPLSKHAVSVLRQLPRDASGRIFPMTANAVDLAWDGVRQKAGLPNLQFRDLRHVGATDYARRGLNVHQMQAILGHKSTFMAQVYVNLVNKDVLDVLDQTDPGVPIYQVPPVASGSAEEIQGRNRSERIVMALRSRLEKSQSKTAATNPTAGSSSTD
jgi:integrase